MAGGDEKEKRRDGWVYGLGVLLGVAAGVVNLEVGDLLLTALLVLSSTMLLGALRPQRPWRWIVVVGVFVPLIQAGAFLFLRLKPDRAQTYESLLGFLTGTAGAYGGAVVRRAINDLYAKNDAAH